MAVNLSAAKRIIFICMMAADNLLMV